MKDYHVNKLVIQSLPRVV